MKYRLWGAMLVLFFSAFKICAQEAYLLKLKPQDSLDYRFQSFVKTVVLDKNQVSALSTSMNYIFSSRLSKISDTTITLIEKVERLYGTASAREVEVSFDTDKPNEGDPTIMAQFSQMVKKGIVSVVKPNGEFVSGESFDNDLFSGTGGGSDFRTVSGNARYLSDSVKVGESWTVIDTHINQGLSTTISTIWTLKAVEADVAILTAYGQGTISGNPAKLPQAQMNGTLTLEGTNKIELKTGISRECVQKIIAKMELELEGQKQKMTTETNSTSKLIN